MKKTWKKLLCSLMLVPCAFFATACGKDDDDNDVNKTINLTAEEQQVAYTTFRTLANSALNNDGSKAQNYTLNSTVENKENINLDNSGLTPENKALIASQRNLSKSKKDTTSIIAGYKANNTGYIYKSTKEYDWDGNLGRESINTKHVKYNGQKYQLYERNGDTKTISNVNNTYAKNVITVNDSLFSKDYDTDKLDYLFDFTQEKTSFDAFKTELVNWTARNVLEDKAHISRNQDLSQYVSTEYAFSVTDGVYTLTIDIDVDATDAELQFYDEDSSVTGEGKLVLSYDKNAIKKLEFEYDSRNEFFLKSSESFVASYQQNFEDSNVVSINYSKILKLSLDFTTQFDEGFFGQSLESYTGTGVDGAVTNIKVDTTIYFRNMGFQPIETQFVYNENLNESITTALASFLQTNGLVVQFSWKDSAEYGDISVIYDNDVVPATRLDVYIELAEEYIEYISTEVVVFDVDNTLEYRLGLFIDDNLYQNVCAILGIVDVDSISIYSDIDCTEKISKDALVTEGMHVYIKSN